MCADISDLSEQLQRCIGKGAADRLESILAAIAPSLARHAVEKKAVRLAERALVEDAGSGCEEGDGVACESELAKRERRARGPSVVRAWALWRAAGRG